MPSRRSLALDRLDDRLNPVTAVFDPATSALTITGTPFTDYVDVRRFGDDIRVNGLLVAGGPTVANTERVYISTGDANDVITIDMSGGAFAGPVPEPTGLPDIGFVIDSGNTPQDTLTILGTPDDDAIDLGLIGATRAVNLNGDDDIDLISTGEFLEYRVFGGRGNDVINGLGTRGVSSPFQGFTLDGGPGNDTLIGGGVGIFNSFEGGGGDDLLVGSSIIDRYFFSGGFLGSDTIRDVADGNNDVLIFSDFTGIGVGDFAGSVSLNLGLTTPQVVNPDHLTLTLAVQNGIDHVIGSKFSDYIVGTEWANILYGGSTTSGRSGNDRLEGLGGNDLLDGEGGNDWLEGGAGNDALYGRAGIDILFGGSGDDLLDGGADGDSVWGDDGNDQVFGRDGGDFLRGGTGDDVIDGGTGNDTLAGGAGDDDLNGGTGTDVIDGGNGNDTLDGGKDNVIDIMIGGAGRDSFRFGWLERFFSDFDPDEDEII